MASGRWEHTAQLVTCVIHLQQIVASFGSKKTIEWASVVDVHPYRTRDRLEELNREYAQAMVRISRLPVDERAAARKELQEEYRRQVNDA